jgi:hypothetical protein
MAQKIILLDWIEQEQIQTSTIEIAGVEAGSVSTVYVAGDTYSIVFDTDLTTTAENFVTSYAATILADHGITVTSDAEIIQFQKAERNSYFSLQLVNPEGAASVSIAVAGTGYTTATDVATTTSGAGTGLTLDITASTGAGTITLTTPGTGYSDSNDVPTTGGSGTGLTVDILETGGIIDTVAINDPGTDYEVNDVVTITTGNADAEITITALDGIVTAVVINQPGTGYAALDTVTVDDGNTDCDVTVDTISDLEGTTDLALDTTDFRLASSDLINAKELDLGTEVLVQARPANRIIRTLQTLSDISTESGITVDVTETESQVTYAVSADKVVDIVVEGTGAKIFYQDGGAVNKYMIVDESASSIETAIDGL